MLSRVVKPTALPLAVWVQPFSFAPPFIIIMWKAILSGGSMV
jgi:hypothetical protein